MQIKTLQKVENWQICKMAISECWFFVVPSRQKTKFRLFEINEFKNNNFEFRKKRNIYHRAIYQQQVAKFQTNIFFLGRAIVEKLGLADGVTFGNVFGRHVPRICPRGEV